MANIKTLWKRYCKTSDNTFIWSVAAIVATIMLAIFIWLFYEVNASN